ncbi:MAG: AbrB/MazE/SpoVT family DNA-binding domain-containing protein [Candidatus Binatia bacterium]
MPDGFGPRRRRPGDETEDERPRQDRERHFSRPATARLGHPSLPRGPARGEAADARPHPSRRDVAESRCETEVAEPPEVPVDRGRGAGSPGRAPRRPCGFLRRQMPNCFAMKPVEMTVDRFGRIVLPKPLRDDLGLEPGAVVRVEEHDRGLVLVPVRDDSGVREDGGVLVFVGSAVGDVSDAVRRSRSRQAPEVGRAQRP